MTNMAFGYLEPQDGDRVHSPFPFWEAQAPHPLRIFEPLPAIRAKGFFIIGKSPAGADG